MTVCVSPGGRNFYQTSGPSNEVLVGTANGIAFITRDGPSGDWHETRRALEGKHISALMIEPSRGVLFAGVHKGGLWASEDGGQSWERRDQGIASDDIYSLNVVQAGDEVRLYAGTEPAHLYVSTNGGASWRDLPALRSVPSVEKWTFPAPPHVGHVKNITFHPGDPNTIYVGVEVGGAFKSTDAGETFQELSGFYEDVHRIMTTPSRPNDVYMSTGHALYHSSDTGTTWEEWTLPEHRIAYPDALLIQPAQPDLMFTAGASGSPGSWRTSKDANARIARSRDAGRTWQYLEGGLPAHLRGNVEAMTMNDFPGGFAVFAGTTDGDVFYSNDEGEHWATIAQGLPPVSKGGHYRNLREDLVAAR